MVYLDAASEDVNERFPLQFFWEISQVIPLAFQRLLAVNILFHFDRTSSVIAAKDVTLLFSYGSKLT